MCINSKNVVELINVSLLKQNWKGLKAIICGLSKNLFKNVYVTEKINQRKGKFNIF